MKARIWLIGIGASYIAACALPAFGAGNMPGIICLIFIPYVVFVPAWYANPLFFAGCVALGRGNGRLAAKLGVVASLLAASFAVQAGGNDLRIGYAAWMISMLGLTTAGFIRREPRDKPSPLDWSGELGAGRAEGAIHRASSAWSPDPGSSSASSSSAPLSSRSPS